MIQNILLIHETGFGLVSRSYGDDAKDLDLFGGLLTAISCFAENLIGDAINEIRMDHHNIFYESEQGVVLAVITPKRTISRRKIATIMRKIHSNFLDRYSEYLRQDFLEPKIFEGFSLEIDSILQKNGILGKTSSPAKEKIISTLRQK
ncbi:MAG: hypothetical protein ACFFE8_11575 [Candidatus Heimdallarchaeota archaeon]